MKAKTALTSLLWFILSFLFLSNSYGQNGVLHEYSFMHDGIERSYLLYVPEGYDGQEDWPLVMVFHGFRIDGRFQMEVSQMNPVADKEKFLIAYPEGLPVLYPLTGEIGTGWIIPGAWEREEHQDDVGFVSKVIDDVNDQYNIDLARVHATGWSNGSHFSFYLACELSDRVASAGGVGGHMTYAQLSSCNTERPVSTILIHGTDDILVPYEGIPDLYPPIPTTPEYWVSQNNCSSEPIVTELPNINTEDNSTITRYEYTNCDGETEMDFYVMNDGGHTWPMGGWPESEVWGNVWPAFLGPVNQDINASEVIWEFFADHPMPTPTIQSFTLVNARNNQDIMELKDGDVLDLSRLPSQLNVRANVMGHPESVQFMLNGDKSQPQNAPPYALFSDRNGDYKPGKFAEGNYMLSATPYTGKTATGIPGMTKEIKFEVVRRSTLAEIVRTNDDFSVLATALRQVGYLSTVSGEGPFTAFAPTNAAFETLLTALNLNDIRQIPIPTLREVIQYHLVIGQEVQSADLTDGQRIKTRQYSDVVISIADGRVMVNDATVVIPDVLASNGVAHAIDQVLLPPAMAAMSAPAVQMEASPNPGASEVSIQVMDHPNQRLEVAIMNQYGWPVSQRSFTTQAESNTNFTLDISDLPPGLYMVQARLQQERQTIRVVR
jgi:polyhydroxybutyrate depolymerase